MSTVNGCGTLYYDWQHLPDGTAHATNWFVLGFFPIAPIERQHLRVITSGEKRSFFSLKSGSTWHVEYQIYGSVPMHALGVARTYFRAYLLLPVILIAPMFVLFRWGVPCVMRKAPQPRAPTPLETNIAAATGFLILLYWGLVVSWILDRAQGRKR